MAGHDDHAQAKQDDDRPPLPRSRRRAVHSDHPARDAEMIWERTFRAYQRIMEETGCDARTACTRLN